MVKQILLLTALGIPLLVYSQTSAYSSVGEKSENGLTLSHVLDYKANVESADGSLSTGPMAPQYTVSATVGLDLVDVTLMSVYPNPTADVLVLKTGGLSNVSFLLSDAEGRILQRSKISSVETSIDFSSYASGVYHLSVKQDGKTVKTFQIVKR